MEFTLRLGQTQATTQFPLPINGAADWLQLDPGVWQTALTLPDLPSEHIIIPSFAMVGLDFRFQFQLQYSSGSKTLRPLPADNDCNLFDLPNDNGTELSDHIDCWHSQTDIRTPNLILRVQCAEQPGQYLATVSIRPLEIEPQGIHANARSTVLQLAQPPAISQMMANPDIRNRICSPTALAMALSHLLNIDDRLLIEKLWAQLIEDCYDPVTKAYGMWPQAIFQASRLGVLASVESSADWRKVEQALNAKAPVICSVRFATDELANAPLTHTAGHLLLLYGITDKKVLVMDPAAATPGTAQRIYDRVQFTAAWLKRRGAAYFFSIPDGHSEGLESRQRSN
ncbi:MAG: C39 family peptidase [Pseudomonadota bacterium]|nr:C39 family peptidase [Pseudomonadota bacterium]